MRGAGIPQLSPCEGYPVAEPTANNRVGFAPSGFCLPFGVVITVV